MDSEKIHSPKQGDLILSQFSNKTYVTKKKIGEGAMGKVYLVRDTNKRQQYAMKTEKISNLDPSMARLKIEGLVMASIRERNCPHLLYLVDRGWDSQRNFKFIVMPLIWKCLEDVQDALEGGFFSKSTAIQVCMQTLTGIAELHDLGFLHRDIKPANLAISLADRRRICLLDYGMCRYYRRPDGYHLHHRGNVGTVGTKIWCSRRVLEGQDFCRADDVETWFYMLVWLASCGKVKVLQPEISGQDLTQGSTTINFDKALYKLKTSFMKKGPSKKCALPQGIFLIWQYVNQLHWYDRPDYEYILEVLSELDTLEGWCNLKETLDWLIPNKIKEMERNWKLQSKKKKKNAEAKKKKEEESRRLKEEQMRKDEEERRKYEEEDRQLEEESRAKAKEQQSSTK